MIQVLYDARPSCKNGRCPKVVRLGKMVAIFHPWQPWKGVVLLSAREWNNLIIDGRVVLSEERKVAKATKAA